MASEIEAALYALYAGASSDYRQHARMLRPGLSLSGRLLAAELPLPPRMLLPHSRKVTT